MSEASGSPILNPKNNTKIIDWADFTDSSTSDTENPLVTRFRALNISPRQPVLSDTENSDDDDFQPDLQLPEVWSFWLDLGNNRACINAEDYVSSLMPIGSFSTVKILWQFLNNLKISSLPKAANLYVFKDGIRPLWEDPKNALGGRWVLSSFAREHTSRLFERFLLAVCGGGVDFGAATNGIALSVRAKGNSLALWTSTVPSTVAPLHKPESSVQRAMRNIRDVVAGCEGGGTLSVEFKTHAGAILSHDSRIRMSVAHAHAAAHAVALTACTMSASHNPLPIAVTGLVPLPRTHNSKMLAPPPATPASERSHLSIPNSTNDEFLVTPSTSKTTSNNHAHSAALAASSFSAHAMPFTPSAGFSSLHTSFYPTLSSPPPHPATAIPVRTTHAVPALLSARSPLPLDEKLLAAISDESVSSTRRSGTAVHHGAEVATCRVALDALVESSDDDEGFKFVRETAKDLSVCSSQKSFLPSPNTQPTVRHSFAYPSPLAKHAISPLLQRISTPISSTLNPGVLPPRTFAELKKESPLIKSSSTPILRPNDLFLSPPKLPSEQPPQSDNIVTTKVEMEDATTANLATTNRMRRLQRADAQVADTSRSSKQKDEDSIYFKKRLARFEAMESTPARITSSRGKQPPHTSIPQGKKGKSHHHAVSSTSAAANSGANMQSTGNASGSNMFGASHAGGWIVSSPAMRSLGEIATWSEGLLKEDMEDSFELDASATSKNMNALVDASSGLVSAAALNRIINPQLHQNLHNEFSGNINNNNFSHPQGQTVGRSSIFGGSHHVDGRRSSLFGTAGRLSALLETPAASVFDVNAAPFIPSFMGRIGGAADGGVRIALSDLGHEYSSCSGSSLLEEESTLGDDDETEIQEESVFHVMRTNGHGIFDDANPIEADERSVYSSADEGVEIDNGDSLADGEVTSYRTSTIHHQAQVIPTACGPANSAPVSTSPTLMQQVNGQSPGGIPNGPSNSSLSGLSFARHPPSGGIFGGGGLLAMYTQSMQQQQQSYLNLDNERHGDLISANDNDGDDYDDNTNERRSTL